MGFPAHKFSVELKKFLENDENLKQKTATCEMSLENEEEYLTKGVFVVPLSYCPHLLEINKNLDKKLIDARRSCTKCNDPKENWICLTCFDTCCSRYVNGHMMVHSKV